MGPGGAPGTSEPGLLWLRWEADTGGRPAGGGEMPRAVGKLMFVGWA
jgi:hypothetical protein